MTGSIRRLALAALALALVPSAVRGQDLLGQFERGVSLMQRGRDDDALAAFRAILAEDPDQAAAYELWKATDGQVWIDILVKQGEFELFARHMMELARLGRAERRNDPDAIRELVKVVANQDGADARAALQTLAADHGEYAVPSLVPFLGDQANDDRRIRVMQALIRMDTDVVLPLVEALQSDDAFLRRNVAYTLARIGDPRALPALAAAAAKDPDGGVQEAAREGAEALGGGDPVELYLQQGDDYHNRRESVLRPYQYSDVIWSWDGSKLVPRGIRRELYNDELAKRAYERALALEPSSLGARAGLVRAWVSQEAKLEELGELGEDVSDLEDWAGAGTVAVRMAGVEAADGALRVSVREGDPRTAVALCRLLGSTADEPTPGLGEALASKEIATRTEAAIALGRIAVATGAREIPAPAIAALSDAAGREVVRIAAVIDADAARAEGVVKALRQAGWLAYGWNKGARGLTMIERVPGVDAVLVGDDVADLTPQQVLAELGRNPRTAQTPKIVLSAAEDAGELYSAADAVFAGASDLAGLDELVGDRMSVDRARAERAAAQAAAALAHMARGGVDVSGAVPGLLRALSDRPDEVLLPATEALAIAGDARTVSPLVAIVADGEHSDAARTAAARALASIFRRGAGASDDEVQALLGVAASDAALSVRQAAALAAGGLDLDAEARVQALFTLAAGGTAE